MSVLPGPGLGRLRLPAHRASSATLAGAYPFLAPAPPGWGSYVGTDAFTGAPFCFDPWTLYAHGWMTNPNVLLAGVIGQGKSALAKTLAIRSIAAGRAVFVPGDPKGEWAAVAAAVGGTVVALGPGLPTRLNPLDGADRLGLLADLAAATLHRTLAPAEHTALQLALAQATARRGPLTLPGVLAALTDPDPATAQTARWTVPEQREVSRDLTHALRRLVHGDLAGMFDAPSTVRVDPGSPMVVLDLSRLGDRDEALSVAMACASAWLDATLSRRCGPRFLVYDEAWRLLSSLPLVRRMQAQWKLSRALGVANLLVLHRLSDLDAAGGAGSEIRAVADGLLADCATRIIYRQETDQLGPTATALGLTGPERELLPALPRGTGLWKLPGGRSHAVHHVLHPLEVAVVDTDSAMTGILRAGVAG
jgi:type IV secretory pathway VirB4 component